MHDVGLRDVGWVLTAGGIIAIHHGTKPRDARSIPAVARIVDAGGAHVPRAARARSRTRLAAVGRRRTAPVLAEHAGATIAAGGKRLRPLLVLLAAGPTASDEPLVRAAAVGRARPRGDARPRRRARRRRAAPRPADGRRRRPGAAMATATGDLLFSRAFAELALNDDAEQIRALSRASSALAPRRAAPARGRLGRRACPSSATCCAAS